MGLDVVRAVSKHCEKKREGRFLPMVTNIFITLKYTVINIYASGETSREQYSGNDGGGYVPSLMLKRLIISTLGNTKQYLCTGTISHTPAILNLSIA